MTPRVAEPDARPSVVVSVDHAAAAEALGMSPTRLREHVRLGDLTPHFSGSKPLYLVADLERFIEQLPTHPARLTSTRTAGVQ